MCKQLPAAGEVVYVYYLDINRCIPQRSMSSGSAIFMNNLPHTKW